MEQVTLNFLADEDKTLAENIHSLLLLKNEAASPSEIAMFFSDKPSSTVRGRIYDNLGKLFKRVGKGLYVAIGANGEEKGLIVNGDARKMDEIADCSIDVVVSDHPWLDKKSNSGTNKKMANYECFNYTSDDFREKARVLKTGGFLVEFLPDENENNFEYIYSIKKMAVEAGFLYYASVPWVKGKLLHQTGRKTKNREIMVFFTKGKPRSLRVDAQRGGVMSGANGMLPAEFDFSEVDFQPSSPSNKIHQAEKPVALCELILDYTSLAGEVVLDQFSGSFNLFRAAIKKNRKCISFEKVVDTFQRSLDFLVKTDELKVCQLA